MLVLLGPPFSGSNEQFAELARLTQLVAYDLRSRVRLEGWSVLRALADAEQAHALVEQLQASGFCAVAVDPQIGHQSDRQFVPWTGVRFEPEACLLMVRGREMPIPHQAMLVVVHGERHLSGLDRPRVSRSSTSLAAVRPSATEMDGFRESVASAEAYWVADLHFITVPWIARVDSRSFDWASLPQTGHGPAQSLHHLVDLVSEHTRVRVDRGAKHSSVNSYTSASAKARSMTPSPGPVSGVMTGVPTDEAGSRFDAYSRLVAEAERLTRRLRRTLGT